MRRAICCVMLMVTALGWSEVRAESSLAATLRQLTRHATTPLEKAAALLPWAAKTVVVGTPNLTPKNADVLLPIFRARTGGGACGLFATFYQDLLTRVGVPAVTVNLEASRPNLTHVTTLVWDGGTFYVFDPTYNGRFLDASGRDVPLPVVFSNRSIVMREVAVNRGVVYPANDIPDPTCLNLRRSSPTTRTCEMTVPATAAVNDAKRNGLQGDFVGALLRARFISVTGATPQQRAALIKILRDARIPSEIAP